MEEGGRPGSSARAARLAKKKPVDYREPESSDPSASGALGEPTRVPANGQHQLKRHKGVRIPYPLAIPTTEEIPDWDCHYIWRAAHYKARDSCGRLWHPKGFALPPISAEWDPPIPEPLNAGERPRILLKTVIIPDGWADSLP